jgi:hypothetical protein
MRPKAGIAKQTMSAPAATLYAPDDRLLLAYFPALARKAATLSMRSQVNSGSSRPK